MQMQMQNCKYILIKMVRVFAKKEQLPTVLILEKK